MLNIKTLAATAVIFSLSILNACGYMQPEPVNPIKTFITDSNNIVFTPFTKNQSSNFVNILVRSRTSAYSIELLIGNKVFQARKSQANDDPPLWSIRLDPCKDLPQGDNISITLNQYDLDKHLIISEQITLSSVHAC